MDFITKIIYNRLYDTKYLTKIIWLTQIANYIITIIFILVIVFHNGGKGVKNK